MKQEFELSFWRHPFTAEDPMGLSDVMLHFFKSDDEKKKLLYFLVGLRVTKFQFLGELFILRMILIDWPLL